MEIKCKDCGETKPEENFYRHAQTRTRRFAYCKPCASLRVRRRRAADPAKAKAVRRAYHLKNLDRSHENSRRWRIANIERWRAYHAAYERDRRARLRAEA